MSVLPWITWIAVLVVATGYALARGEAPERIVAVGSLIAYAISLRLVRDAHWAGLKLSMIAVAAGLSVLILAVALSARRFWPLPAAAIQILSTVVLLMRAIDPTIRPLAYYFAEKLFDYGGLIVLAVGTYVEVDRRRREPEAA